MKGLRRHGAAALVLLLSAAAPIAAQQDTVKAPADSLKVKAVAVQPKPDRWKAALDLGLNASTGNSRLTVLSTTVRVRHLQTQSFELEWAATYRYGESRGDVVARNAGTSLNLDVRPRADVSPFAFATVEHDPFRRLDVRSNTGAGVKYTLYRHERGTASLSLAGLHSYEGFTTDQPTRIDARWSARVKLDQRIGGTARFESTAFYKPVWDHGADYNVQVLNKLSSKITERLAMTLTHEYLHDSTPPAGVAREDQRFQAGATLEFF